MNTPNNYMRHVGSVSLLLILLFLIPNFALSQTINEEVTSFHKVLGNLYKNIIPLAGDLLQASIAIGGFGAIWYIGVRVWKHLAAAEPIDFFPLFRPFVITLVLSFYPIFLGLLNGILYPTVAATNDMVKRENDAVYVLLEKRGDAILKSEEWKTLAGGIGNDDEEWRKYGKEEDIGENSLSQGASFSIALLTNGITYVIKLLIAIILETVYYAASLCIDAMRTFQLLILSILGPFVLSLSIYDGFHQALVSWIGRYINIYLWLPVANIFGALISKIQQGMLEISIDDMANGNLIGFGQTDIGYFIFLIIAILGYFSIPNVANYIVQASGAAPLASKITSTILMAKGAMGK
ncbi:conjugative transposon protein TraJ [Paraflavitalea sp. CAU 1676]|uniref:conjugative transposon protein TraJ n=1 Tax=Paraflavitalea sp. CAU 1676 TaxID=3032598 RepID=UPI0023DC06D6|nr:conjugative transposon protein TraJ [Paraflavitalea sp. CAU 1676]MDF2190506.1 conjugative transposon protein TraJ [Paraflavitalea sp. CAU 1676]